jgi:murein DD-endopeptidase MepM/ murein hydrolase activator NlpD
VKSIFLSILAFFGLYTPISPGAIIVSPPPQAVISNFPTPVPLAKSEFNLPSVDFLSRITKKPFGIHITPNSSPVKPEKFTGYHTGVDAEYEDILTEVPVHAIHSGKIIYSGFVKGYGGLVAQSLNYKNSEYIVLYGHLAPSSLSPLGTVLTTGQSIGVLGKGYSPETDGERRHLHLAIIKGSKLNLKGYVSQEVDLALWQNPVDFLNLR